MLNPTDLFVSGSRWIFFFDASIYPCYLIWPWYRWPMEIDGLPGFTELKNGWIFPWHVAPDTQVFNNAVAAGDAQQRREENRSIPPGTKKLGTDLGKAWENLGKPWKNLSMKLWLAQMSHNPGGCCYTYSA